MRQMFNMAKNIQRSRERGLWLSFWAEELISCVLWSGPAIIHNLPQNTLPHMLSGDFLESWLWLVNRVSRVCMKRPLSVCGHGIAPHQSCSPCSCVPHPTMYHPPTSNTPNIKCPPPLVVMAQAQDVHRILLGKMMNRQSSLMWPSCAWGYPSGLANLKPDRVPSRHETEPWFQNLCLPFPLVIVVHERAGMGLRMQVLLVVLPHPTQKTACCSTHLLNYSALPPPVLMDCLFQVCLWSSRCARQV